MSNAAIAWQMKLLIPPGPKHVLMVLADRGNNHQASEDWACFPDIEQLLDDTSLPLRSLERHLGWLFKAGVVSTRMDRTPRGRMKVRHYDLHRAWTPADLPAEMWPDLPEHLVAKLAEAGFRPPAILAGGEGAGLLDGQGEGGASSVERPPANMAGGDEAHPPAKTPPSGPPIWRKPPANMADASIEELSGTQRTPKTRAAAREGGQGFWETFDKVAKAVPAVMRKATRWPAARRAWSKVCRTTRPEAILEAAKRMAADTDIRKRHFLPGLEVWLGEEMFTEWCAGGEGPSAAPAEQRSPLLAGAPVKVVDLILTRQGEDWARAWLHGAVWRAADSTIVCSLGFRADRLRTELGRELQALTPSVSVAGPGDAAAPAVAAE